MIYSPPMSLRSLVTGAQLPSVSAVRDGAIIKHTSKCTVILMITKVKFCLRSAISPSGEPANPTAISTPAQIPAPLSVTMTLWAQMPPPFPYLLECLLLLLEVPLPTVKVANCITSPKTNHLVHLGSMLIHLQLLVH